jgi:Ser/Thr protein kinase RdoA (MazF antagonist)
MIASAVTWLDGAPIGAKEAPRTGTLADQVAIYRGLGALMAELHDMTDLPGVSDGITRPQWNLEGFLGAAPRWGRFWENPALTAPEKEQARAAREAARAALNARPERDMGLIHADILQENVLFVGGDLALIDFDDSGYGYRAYDLATGLIQHAESRDFESLQEALIAGYTSKRGDADTLALEMPLFLLLRSMASAGWIISRAAPDDPIQRYYSDRMLRFARTFSKMN